MKIKVALAGSFALMAAGSASIFFADVTLSTTGLAASLAIPVDIGKH